MQLRDAINATLRERFQNAKNQVSHRESRSLPYSISFSQESLRRHRGAGLKSQTVAFTDESQGSFSHTEVIFESGSSTDQRDSAELFTKRSFPVKFYGSQLSQTTSDESPMQKVPTLKEQYQKQMKAKTYDPGIQEPMLFKKKRKDSATDRRQVRWNEKHSETTPKTQTPGRTSPRRHPMKSAKESRFQVQKQRSKTHKQSPMQDLPHTMKQPGKNKKRPPQQEIFPQSSDYSYYKVGEEPRKGTTQKQNFSPQSDYYSYEYEINKENSSDDDTSSYHEASMMLTSTTSKTIR